MSNLIKDRLLFLHIPKAGGTSLHNYLKHSFPARKIFQIKGTNDLNKFKELPFHYRNKYRFISGHFHMNNRLHDLIGGDYKYITILRDPIERVISLYYFIPRGNHYLSEEYNKTQFDLKTFVETGMTLETDNFMTRQLMLDYSFPPYGECTKEMLRDAKSTLINYFSFVGLLEQFDQSLDILKEKFGIAGGKPKKLNVTPNRPKRESIAPQTLKIIEKHNKYDIELYNYVLEKFW